MRSDSLGIVPYAALVERLVDGHHQRPLLETTGAALYGSGIRQGYAMYLPNAGGQWQTQFNRAAISVEVVGESEVEVRELQTKLVERITVTADERQASMGVAPTAYITTSLSPESPEVHFHATHPLHAAVALGLLAVGFSIVAGRMLNDVIIRRATSENSRNPAMTS